MSSRIARTREKLLVSRKAQVSLIEVNAGRGPESRILTKMSLSKGEHLALVNALEEYAKISPVGADVFAYVKNAMIYAGLSP